ncbi:MAG TPA: iron-sulfur cluster assembly protein [Planctomycetota bacterium]
MPTIDDVYSELRQVYDPEIPVNIVDLGLVYDVQVQGDACSIKMTLTSQSCPEARSIPEVVKRRVGEIEGVGACQVEIVWEPAWTPQRISPNGRRILGLPDEGEPQG